MLTPKQTRFVEEYLVDLNGKQAGIRAGYAPASAEVQPSRLLRKAKVQKALEAAMQARSKRTEVTADFSVTEFAKVAFANVWDFLPKKARRLTYLESTRTAPRLSRRLPSLRRSIPPWVLHCRTRLKLHDKQAALASLARHLGMFQHVAEGSIEQRVMRMSP